MDLTGVVVVVVGGGGGDERAAATKEESIRHPGLLFLCIAENEKYKDCVHSEKQIGMAFPNRTTYTIRSIVRD